jgi:hypothetical protein
VKVEIGEYPDEGEQKVVVHIDKWDTWSMDYTLAPIILPMLKQLKETKHGSPNVDNLGETDPDFFKRWDWVLDEMIYAFDCKANKDEVYMRFDIKDRIGIKKEQDRISNGFRLFGKYYESLWD